MKKVIVISTILLVAKICNAQTATATMNGGGQWNNPLTWAWSSSNHPQIPDCSTPVIIPNLVHIYTSANILAHSITVKGKGHLTLNSGQIGLGCSSQQSTFSLVVDSNGKLTSSAGSFPEIYGSVYFNNGSIINLSGALTIEPNGNNYAVQGDILTMGALSSSSTFNSATITITNPSTTGKMAFRYIGNQKVEYYGLTLEFGTSQSNFNPTSGNFYIDGGDVNNYIKTGAVHMTDTYPINTTPYSNSNQLTRKIRLREGATQAPRVFAVKDFYINRFCGLYIPRETKSILLIENELQVFPYGLLEIEGILSFMKSFNTPSSSGRFIIPSAWLNTSTNNWVHFKDKRNNMDFHIPEIHINVDDEFKFMISTSGLVHPDAINITNRLNIIKGKVRILNENCNPSNIKLGSGPWSQGNISYNTNGYISEGGLIIPFSSGSNLVFPMGNEVINPLQRCLMGNTHSYQPLTISIPSVGQAGYLQVTHKNPKPNALYPTTANCNLDHGYWELNFMDHIYNSHYPNAIAYNLQYGQKTTTNSIKTPFKLGNSTWQSCGTSTNSTSTYEVMCSDSYNVGNPKIYTIERCTNSGNGN